tara:strand:+ start:26248 stop:26769 length:522 start_codon:yes stop_codon:yes gene_type:complete
MKIGLSIFVLLLGISTSSCKQEKKLPDNEVSNLWSHFLNTLEKNDKVAFKKASNETIRCYDCLENTPSEVQKMNLLRDTDSLWYDKIYDDLINIPIDQFIKNDFDILFNPQFVKILRDIDISFLEDNENEVKTVHILVTTTPPTAKFEGAQHSFSFTKTIDGLWKLNEISTIP